MIIDRANIQILENLIEVVNENFCSVCKQRHSCNEEVYYQDYEGNVSYESTSLCSNFEYDKEKNES